MNGQMMPQELMAAHTVTVTNILKHPVIMTTIPWPTDDISNGGYRD